VYPETNGILFHRTDITMAQPCQW